MNSTGKKISLSLVIFLLVLAGCRTVQVEPPPEPEPEPAAEEPVPFRNPIVFFEAHSEPATGFNWEIWIDHESTGRFAVNRIRKIDLFEGIKNSPQRQEFTLRSSREGRVIVHFIYKRPHQGGADLGRYIYTFNIDENLRISLLDKQRNENRNPRSPPLPVIQHPVISNFDDYNL